MLQQSDVCPSLGNIRTETARLDHCVAQGAPESPFLFILVSGMALASLHESWAKRSLVYLIDDLWLSDVAYADDVVLLSMSITALQTMLLEVEEACAAVGPTSNLWRRARGRGKSDIQWVSKKGTTIINGQIARMTS